MFPRQPFPPTSCTDWESVEQVCEHLSGQGALPPAHERTQSLLEDGGDPSHVYCTHEPQLHTHGRVCVNGMKSLKHSQHRFCLGCVTERDVLDLTSLAAAAATSVPFSFLRSAGGAPRSTLTTYRAALQLDIVVVSITQAKKKKNVGKQERRKVVFASCVAGSMMLVFKLTPQMMMMMLMKQFHSPKVVEAHRGVRELLGFCHQFVQ